MLFSIPQTIFLVAVFMFSTSCAILPGVKKLNKDLEDKSHCENCDGKDMVELKSMINHCEHGYRCKDCGMVYWIIKD